MIYYLVISCTLLSLTLSFIAMLFFSKSIHVILTSVLPKELSLAWSSYMRYMIIVVGLGGGINLYHYEKYLGDSKTALTDEGWVLELYQSLLNTLTAIGWLMFWLFLAALVAFIFLKVKEPKKPPVQETLIEKN